MKKIEVGLPWLTCCVCNKKGGVKVMTKGISDNLEWVYEGDSASCSNCGSEGIIECDDNTAWVAWNENPDLNDQE